VLATKVYYPMGPGPNDRGLGRKHVLAAVDASLSRLGTEYVDLYQVHRWNDETPIEETMEALHDVVRAGKARYIGASSMYAWQFAKAQFAASAAGWTRFVSMQNHYNLVYREEEREMIPLCLDHGVGLIPWSPLARGMLAGTRERGSVRTTVRSGTDPYAEELYGQSDFDVVDAVRAVAEEHGTPPAQIALAWLLRHPIVSAPIVGATKVSHVDDAVAAIDVRLNDETWADWRNRIARISFSVTPEVATAAVTPNARVESVRRLAARPPLIAWRGERPVSGRSGGQVPTPFPSLGRSSRQR
jgi:aryl-alcohol dehydrogenase-like predicted oxidoreductase